MSDLTTYQIYLILLGYLAERHDDTEMLKTMLVEFYKRANNAEKIGHCKDCKYFEYDSVAKVDGIPLIVAHENCSRWGDECKTKEDGYCFLFESQESEG